MNNKKIMVSISILVLALSSVVYFSTQTTMVSAVELPYEGEYRWMGGYLNVSFSVVNLTYWELNPTDPYRLENATIANTVMNQSLDFWEDLENFTFATGGMPNVGCPAAAYAAAPSAIYSAELTQSFGFLTWYIISMQWRPFALDGYGNYYSTDNTGDVDYYSFINGTHGAANTTSKYGIKSLGQVVEVDIDGDWIGSDGTGDDLAGSMWARQPLFINVTFYLGGKPPGQLITMPLVAVNMDSWLTTGSAYSNVTNMPDNPLNGKVVSGVGQEWDSELESAAFISCGGEVNQFAYFEHPISHVRTPVNVSYLYAHKHYAVRSDLPVMGDATQDGLVNLWDKGRLSDYWLWDTTSAAYGELINDYQMTGQWGKMYTDTKGVNSVDFNGDELINLWDKGKLSDSWLDEGWVPPHPA